MSSFRDVSPGELRVRERFRQAHVFTGFSFGRISPTDIDAIIEYQNQAFLFFEFKYATTRLLEGQSKALTRLADACTRGGKHTLLVVAEHHIDDCAEAVVAARTTVRAVYYRGQWFPLLDQQRTAYDIAAQFIACVIAEPSTGAPFGELFRRCVLKRPVTGRRSLEDL